MIKFVPDFKTLQTVTVYCTVPSYHTYESFENLAQLFPRNFVCFFLFWTWLSLGSNPHTEKSEKSGTDAEEWIIPYPQNLPWKNPASHIRSYYSFLINSLTNKIYIGYDDMEILIKIWVWQSIQKI